MGTLDIGLTILPGDLQDSRVVEMLHAHMTRAHAETATGSAHALDLTGLQSPDIRLWTVFDGDTLLGVGALKRLTADHGEVKSMYVDESKRRSGAGGAMLRHIIATARADGVTRLSLETGSWPYFQPARALYARHGFVPCPPFAGYVPDRNSVFLSLTLPVDAPHAECPGDAPSGRC
jgi:putative acetyltransferase